MGQSLLHRSILLIISGGVAAYKSLDLIRRLKEEGARVRCVLTDGGAKFITPLSVTVLSGEPVFTNMFSDDHEEMLGHIKLSRESDLIVIAPASANMMAKMAHGLAEGLAATLLLASNKPILIAPSMNCMMWQHPATQANIATLVTRGIKQVGPASGSLACGEEGAGRMSEPEAILAAIKSHFETDAPLRGKKALVTSGPTYEPLDPVRFIGNRSSGKQGHAIALALAAQGAEVTLVTGPTALADPAGIETIHIETAREMLAACEKRKNVDIVVCAAAVADWRPETESAGKLKKGEAKPAALALTENPDILATLSQSGASRPRLVIGFAAETDDLMNNAAAKIARKGCDWLVANSVQGGQVFGEEENEVILFTLDPHSGGVTSEPWPRASKAAVATRLVDKIVERLS